jgi:hypothetical protein
MTVKHVYFLRTLFGCPHWLNINWFIFVAAPVICKLVLSSSIGRLSLAPPYIGENNSSLGKAQQVSILESE